MKISEYPLVTSVSYSDKIIVETTNGTHTAKVEQLKEVIGFDPSELEAANVIGGNDTIIVQFENGSTKKITYGDLVEQLRNTLASVDDVTELENKVNAIPTALVPAGSVPFANLPSLSTTKVGYMYNITNAFVTTADFNDGANRNYPEGSNVYKTEDGKWDVMAGLGVMGVKGSEESIYRRGQVNITPANLGLGNVLEDLTKKIQSIKTLPINHTIGIDDVIFGPLVFTENNVFKISFVELIVNGPPIFDGLTPFGTIGLQDVSIAGASFSGVIIPLQFDATFGTSFKALLIIARTAGGGTTRIVGGSSIDGINTGHISRITTFTKSV